MEKNKQGKKGQLVIIISGKLRQRRQIIQTSQQGISRNIFLGVPEGFMKF